MTAVSNDGHHCSHPECEAKLPVGTSIAPRWTVMNVEVYGEQIVTRSYYYLCPKHTFTTTAKQTTLFEDSEAQI